MWRGAVPLGKLVLALPAQRASVGSLCGKNAGLFGHRWDSRSHFEKLFFPPEAWSLLLKEALQS